MDAHVQSSIIYKSPNLEATQCPPTHERSTTAWPIGTTECSSALERKGVPTQAVTCTAVKDTMLSEMRHHKRTDTAWLHVHEVPRVVEFTRKWRGVPGQEAWRAV